MLARVARDFAVELVAEGIESREDLDVCFQERVFAAQGHFLAMPQEGAAPASPELKEWLAARRPMPEPLGEESSATLASEASELDRSTELDGDSEAVNPPGTRDSESDLL
jgi:EAL domain-containing protein (putative c-di-GMP-specific phosphodiesterase class I)